MKIKNIIVDILEVLILAVPILYLTSHFVASMEVVVGESMSPNFHTGQRIIVDKVSPRFQNYERGEVVVLTPEKSTDKHYLKRVIGIPGDIIKVYDCKVYVSRDGQRFTAEESYLREDECTKGGNSLRQGRSIKLLEDEFIVLGDNRNNSVDSRSFGPVKKSDILGRVIFRFWPIRQAGFI